MIGRRELLRRVGKRSSVGVVDGAENSEPGVVSNVDDHLRNHGFLHEPGGVPPTGL